MTVENLTHMVSDQDNFRLTLAWFDERAESDMLMHLSMALFGLWLTQGLYREGLHWIGQALERTNPMASRSRAEALAAGATLALFQGDYARAAAVSAEGLTQARESGEPFLVAKASQTAGFVSYRSGDYGQAEDHLDEALRLFRDLGETVPDAVPEVAVSLMLRADTALAQRQFDRAAARYTEASEIAQSVAALWTVIDAQTGLAAVEYCTGNTARAAARYIGSLHRAQQVGITLLVASALFGLAGVAAESGLAEEGARLLGAAEASAAFLGAPVFPRDQPVRDRALAAITDGLGEQRFAAAREAGRTLTLEDAIGEAQVVAEAVTRSR